MKPNEIVELPHVDEDGYFDGLCACMADADGQLMLGADTYIEVPADDGKHFYKLSADKSGWEAEAIPATPEACAGIVLDHYKQTKRIHQLREVFEELTKSSTTYRLVQNPETNARRGGRLGSAAREVWLLAEAHLWIRDDLLAPLLHPAVVLLADELPARLDRVEALLFRSGRRGIASAYLLLQPFQNFQTIGSSYD